MATQFLSVQRAGAAERHRRRELRLLRQDADRHAEAARRAGSARVGAVERRARRGGRQALRRRSYFPPEAKAADGRARREPARRARAASSADVDERRDARRRRTASSRRFRPKIGYPTKWRDYSTARGRRGRRARQRAARRRLSSTTATLAKLGKPVDRDEWGMTPQTVNAYYNPALNEIVFPAAILQPPFFDPNADDAVNYGGIGARDRPRDQPRLRRPGQPSPTRRACCATGGPTDDVDAFKKRDRRSSPHQYCAVRAARRA